MGFVSKNNSSIVPLGAGETFIGEWDDIVNQASIQLIINTDVAGDLSFEFSTDRENIDLSVPVSVVGQNPSGKFSVVPTAKFARIRLVNGASPQGHLRLQTIYDDESKVSIVVSESIPASAVQTPSLTRVTDSGSVAEGATSVNVFNAGGADATVAGDTIKQGESVPFVAADGKVLGAISYNGTGTELVISKVV